MKSPSIETHNSLLLCCLTEEQREKTCHYWYTMLSKCHPQGWHSAHTAFRTQASILAWLEARGLSLSKDLPCDLGTHQTQQIEGSYSEARWLDTKAFGNLQGKRIRVMSNGDFTLGIATRDETGHVTINHLNVNCRRPVYDHRDSQIREDAGYA